MKKVIIIFLLLLTCCSSQLERHSKEVRCKAITKQGTQCKRYTTALDSLCWQHSKK